MTVNHVTSETRVKGPIPLHSVVQWRIKKDSQATGWNQCSDFPSVVGHFCQDSGLQKPVFCSGKSGAGGIKTEGNS